MNESVCNQLFYIFDDLAMHMLLGIDWAWHNNVDILLTKNKIKYIDNNETKYVDFQIEEVTNNNVYTVNFEDGTGYPFKNSNNLDYIQTNEARYWHDKFDLSLDKKYSMRCIRAEEMDNLLQVYNILVPETRLIRYMDDKQNQYDCSESLFGELVGKETKSNLIVLTFEEQVDEVLKADNILDKDEFNKLRQFLLNSEKNFNDKPGRTSMVSHKINTGSHKPIQRRAYPVNPVRRKIIDEHVKQMLEDNIIVESYSSWSAPVVLVAKPDKTFRFCVDYRQLNSITASDQFPMPNMENIIAQLEGSKYISTMDMVSGYWQVPIDPMDKDKTSFITHSGLYSFNVMSFGLKGAPATFCRLMSKVLDGLIGICVFCYLDDIVIFSKTFEEHLIHLEKVFDRLYNDNLFIKLKKCQFCRINCKFLGKIISKGTVKIDPDKIKAITEYVKPSNVKQVQRFLGMTGWLRNHVYHFANIVKPLIKLTRKNVKFVWNTDCEEAFIKLKEALVQPDTVLVLPDFNKKFTIETDASGEALGAILTQEGIDGCPKIVEYASRLLKDAEKNFSSTELECLGLIFAIKKFNSYIIGTRFTIITDNQALKWLMKTKDIQGRLTRWALRLQEYDFDIVYRTGRDNLLPDALSRASSITEDDVEVDFDRMAPPGTLHINMLTVIEPNFIFLNNVQELIKAQDDNNWISKMKIRIRENMNNKKDITQNRFKKFVLISDILCYKPMSNKAGPRIVIPDSLINKTIQEFHDRPYAGHMGRDKTLTNLRNRVFWHNMAKDVSNYVHTCRQCQLVKPVNVKLRPPMEINYVKEPLELVGFDLMGPYPRSKLGNRFLLVMVDYFSKWVEIIPLRNSNTLLVTKYIEEFFSRFGIPQRVVSDNGPQFVSTIYKKLCKNWKTKISYTSYYHPQSNLVERINRNIKNMIRCFVENDHSTWDKYIQQFALALRSSVNVTTGYTPAKLFLNRELRLPWDVTCNINEKSIDGVATGDKVKNLESEMQDIYKFVREHSKRMKEKQKKYYDRNTVDRSYEIGDTVKLRSHLKSDLSKQFTSKFAKPWKGPYFIKDKIGNVVYELSDEQENCVGRYNIVDIADYYCKGNHNNESCLEDNSDSEDELPHLHNYNTRLNTKRLQIEEGKNLL